MDDKIKFNTEEFSLFVTSEEKKHCIRRRFHNKTDNITQFRDQLDTYDFKNPELVRPSFDTYFMRLAWIAASRSNCMKAGIGAVIAKGNRVLTTGYNGTPGGLLNCNEGGCKRCNGNPAQGKDLDRCVCLHAEESALLEAGRTAAMGATLYTTHFPCQLCTRKIIACGIKRIVYNKFYDSPLSRELLS